MQKKVLHIVSEGKTTATTNVYADLTFKPDEMIIKHVSTSCTDSKDAGKIFSVSCNTLNGGPLAYFMGGASVSYDLRYLISQPIPTMLQFLFDRTGATDTIRSVISIEFVQHKK